MKTIIFRPGGRNTRINIGDRFIGKCLKQLTGTFPFLKRKIQAAVISQPNIAYYHYEVIRKSLSGMGWKTHHYDFPDGEESKSFSSYEMLMEKLLSNQRETDLIIAFGGGVVGDLSGFVAATYRRGVPIIQIPTTLIGMVDSAIGGKTAVNFQYIKNMIGAYHHPIAVISDVQFLKTLPEREFISGLGEVIKYGVVLDTKHFDYMKKNLDHILVRSQKHLLKIIETSSRIKARIVEKDEFDSLGIRNSLNFGHTIGHAVESSTHLSSITHGEAVAIGMAAESYLANQLKLISENYLGEIIELITDYHLPVNLREQVDSGKIYHYMLYDKKNRLGKIRIALPTGRGKFKVVEDIKKSDLMNAIKFIQTRTS